MDNTYSNSYASLHTVKHDTTVLDAQKILIRTPEDSVASRTDLIEYINKENDKAITLTNNLTDSLSIYLNKQVYKSPAVGDGGIGGANILVAPANIFDPSLIYTHVMFQGSFADGYSDPVYLGMLLWDAEGNKSIVGVSEAFNPRSIEGNTILFSFSKNSFTIPADHRIIFYFLKSSEDIALDYPSYDSPLPKIKVSANKAIYDPYGRWNDAQTDINLGFHCDGGFNADSAWDSWPIFSLLIDAHHSNGAHLTAEQLQKLNNLDSEKIDIDIDSVKDLIEKQASDIDNLETLIEKQTEDIDNLETTIKGEPNNQTFNSNIVNGTPDNATVIGIQYGSGHFVKNAEINSISIPYGDKNTTRPTGYLVAELYNKDGLLISRHYSEDPFTYSASNTTATFEFKKFVVPRTYKLIRFALVADKTIIPDFSDSNICKEFRCKPIGIDSNNDGRLEFDNFDDDDCQIFAAGGNATNWLIDINVNYTQYEGGLINDINATTEQFNADIFNANTEITRIDNFISGSYKALNDKVTQLETKSDTHLTLEEANELFAAKSENDGNYAVINAENTFSESNTFTKDVTIQNTLYSLDSQNQTSSSATILASKSINIGRESLNSEELHNIKNMVLGHNEVIVSNMEGSGAIGQVVAARLANPFFTSGTISNVRIFHNTAHTALFDNEPRYLYLNVDGTIYRSEAVVWDGPVSYTDFKFNNIVIPEDYSLVDVLMSKNGALENPSYTNRTGSVNFSSSIAYAAETYGNSRVRIYQEGEAEIAQSAIIKVEVTTGATTGNTIADTISTLTESVSTLTATAEEHITAEYFDSLVYKLAENASGTADCDAIHYKANKVPHNFAIDEIGIPVTNTITTPTYLAVWTVNQSDQKTYIGLSDNAITWNNGDIATWSFRNNPISVPENHNLELFLTLAEPPEGSNNATAPGYYIGTHCDYSGSGTMRWGGDWHRNRDVYTIFKQLGINDRISYLENNGTNNEEINNLEERITNLEGADVTINQRIDYLSEQLRDNVQTEITENLTGKDVDLVFDSNDLGVGNGDYSHNDAANIKCARVSKAHFIKPGCMLKSITIPYKNNIKTWTNHWLHIQYYDLTGNIIVQHTSNNQQNATVASDDVYYEATWTFDNELYAPTNYAYIHINISANKTDVPTTTTNCTSFRVSIVRDANNVNFDDDECSIWLENNNNGNYLLNYKVAYVERVGALPQLDSIINNAVTEALAGYGEYSFKVTPKYNGDTLSHFDISSGNVYLENKQIVQIPTKTNLQMNSALGESQYVVLNVFNNPNGTVSYSYNAVNEDELIELGYTMVTPVEETIDLSN